MIKPELTSADRVKLCCVEDETPGVADDEGKDDPGEDPAVRQILQLHSIPILFYQFIQFYLQASGKVDFDRNSLPLEMGVSSYLQFIN